MIHHEFWPTSLLSAPLYFYYLGQAIRFGSLNYFAWANPGMENGGLVGYQKHKILNQLPDDVLPTTLLIDRTQTPEEVESLFQAKKLSFPVIAKPDQGLRSFGVKMLKNFDELKKYHQRTKLNYLLQAFVDEPEEFSVFVMRTSSGFQISSLTQKDFLILFGDGRSTLKELYYKNPRASKYVSEHHLPHYSDRVLEVGQKIILQPIGDRNRGTKYINANSMIDERLTERFDQLTKKMPQFFYGNFDVKAESVAALLEGNFKVLSVSGVGAFPAHIYDSNYKLSQAYKDLFWHWKQISQIVKVNKKKYSKESFMTTFKTVFKYYFSRGEGQ